VTKDAAGATGHPPADDQAQERNNDPRAQAPIDENAPEPPDGDALNGLALVGKDGGLGMEIEDDGQGFDMTGTSEGQGLANLRARTRECGGKFSIDSRPGGPTILAAWIPHRPTSA
jgi:hypothetical protein